MMAQCKGRNMSLINNKSYTNLFSCVLTLFFFLLALQPPLGVVFYSPLAGFSLLAYEVS